MYRTNVPTSSKRPLLILGIVLAVLVVGLIISEVTNTTHLFHGKKTNTVQTSANQMTKGEPAARSSGTSDKTISGNAATNTVPKSQSDDSKATGTSTAILIDPTGTFVSAHQNVPADAPLSSVCNTTVGATCKIQFTSGAVTKSLPTQSTDSGGTVYWNSWTPSSIGLTSGTWQVKAIAELSGKSATTSDALSLEVK